MTDTNPTQPPVPTPRSAEATLELILHRVEEMNRRDKLRTWGAFVRGLLGIIPLAVFLASLWYVYNNGEALLEKMAQQAAKQAAIYTQEQADGMMERFFPNQGTK